MVQLQNFSSRGLNIALASFALNRLSWIVLSHYICSFVNSYYNIKLGIRHRNIQDFQVRTHWSGEEGGEDKKVR